MNEKIKATVGILTFNSGSTLQRALESVKDFTEVIICDGGSLDDTLAIAKQYGCKIIYQDKDAKNRDNTIRDFSMVRNQCIDAASFDWFLYIDSDEAASPELVAEIRYILNTQKGKYIYKIPIKILIGSHLIKYSSNYPGYQTRFFNKKSGARFVKAVHERIEYDKEKFASETLTSPWYIYMTDDEAENYLASNLSYAKKEAVRHMGISSGAYIKWILWGNLKTILKILLRTLLNYVLHGFRDTMPLSVEWGRIQYAATVFVLITKNLFVKPTVIK